MLFFVLAFLAAAVTAEVSSQDHALFKQWMGKHTKVYQTAEETQYRLSIFAENAKFVRNFDTTRSFTVGLNQFADLSNQEFRALFNGLNISKVPGPVTLTDVSDTADTVDWRKQGAVTGVKNQGQCGSCWSFSTTGSVEGAWKLFGGKQLVSLSEQNLVDCSTAQGNQGCNGGLMDQAFQYIISNNGVDTEDSYPYTATGPNQCQFNPSNVGAKITGYQDVNSGDEGALQKAVNQQPVSVAIDASQQSFQLYTGGVYNEPACSSTQLDHGVLAVGYGTDNTGTDYWIVKNSWGPSWGLQGYILMSRNANNQCGIATAASYPTIN